MEGPEEEASQRVIGAPPFVATLLAFGTFGVITGVWEVLLADLRTALSLSTGAFGLALTGGFVAALPAMILAGRIVDRFSPRILIGLTGLVMALALFGVSRVESYWPLIGAFMVYFAANSAYDVGINAAGIDVEQMNDRQVMAYFHAAFSGFAAIGALVTGALLVAEITFRLLYIGLAIGVAIIAALLVWSRTLPNGHAEQEATGSTATRSSLFRDFAVVLVAMIVFFGYFAEGTIENWAAIYLRTWLEFSAVVGASGVALFHTAMAIGRLGGARLIEGGDRRRLLRRAGMLGTVGMTMVVATTIPAVILVGVFVVGLSLSVVSPIGYSLAGDLAPGRSGEASSVVTFVGWGAFIVGPALIGGLAEVVGLRLALATVVLTTGAIAFLAYRVPEVS